MFAAQAQEERGESFALQLVTTALPAELRAWLARAEVGERAVYAAGAVLPRQAETVQLVTRWKDAGAVITLQRRDPADGRRMQYLIEKADAGHGPHPPAPDGVAESPPNDGRAGRGTHDATRAQMRRLLEALRRMAARGEACPSNAELAALLELPRGKRGADRAQYLIGRLVREQRIAVEGRGTCAPRVVTILAKGRGCGKSTHE